MSTQSYIKKIFVLALLIPQLSLFAQEAEEERTSDIPPTPEELRDEGYLINFPNVDIIEYIRFISQITNKNFIYKEEELQFRVTILSEEPTSIENILAALIQILRIHGLQLLEQGNNLIIHRNENIQQAPRVVQDPKGETGIVTRVFQLKNADPESVMRIVQPLVSKGSLVEISRETKHLIVTDIGSNVLQIARLLEDLDAPNLSLDIGFYQTRYSHIASLVDLAEKILAPLGEPNPLIMVPQATSKKIFIVSTPYLIKKAQKVLATLDIPSGEQETALPPGHIDNTNFYIHKLQYHMGQNLISSLQEIAANLLQAENTNQNLVNTIRSAQWLSANNSLIFTGDQSSLKKVRELIHNLDVPVKQVLIEMLIIDTSISKSLDFGVEWGLVNRRGSKGAMGMSFINNENNTSISNALIAAESQNMDPTGFIGGQGLNFGVIGEVIRHNSTSYTNLSALVHALQSDQDTNILLNPRLVTQDTNTAKMFIGNTTAFQASQSVNTQGEVITVNLDYRELGTMLQVTPILGSNNIVTLEIEQEISNSLVIGADANQLRLGPVATKSSTKTKVHVPNQHFLIISGMIRETMSKTETKVPCLGGIPYVGKYFFGRSSPANEKSNVMIFLRPHIVTTEEEILEMTEKHKRIYNKKMGDQIFNLEELMEND